MPFMMRADALRSCGLFAFGKLPAWWTRVLCVGENRKATALKQVAFPQNKHHLTGLRRTRR